MSTLIYYVEFLTAGYVGVTLALFMISFVVPGAGFPARLLASYASLITVATFSFFFTLFLHVAGYAGLSQWVAARCFKVVMRLTTGVQFAIDDPHDYLGTTRPAVFIGNHQTELDVLMLGHIFPKYCSVTAKRSLQKLPILGWWMTLSGSIFIDRANSKSARSAMAGAAETIQKRRQSVYMFPEGTRSYSKEPMLLPFKKGAFHLAVQAGVPIVPVVVANYSNVLYVKDFHFTSGTIPIKVLEPIETKNLTSEDVDDLTRDTREKMLQELLVLTAKARGQPIAMPAQSSSNGVVKASSVEATK